MAGLRDQPGIVQARPMTDAATGMISAVHWQSNAALTAGAWRTGLYVLELIATDGGDTYIPLVVRDDAGRRPPA